MLRLIIGSLVAAAVTFLMGWGFFATPMQEMGYAKTSPAVEEQLRAALAALPETGTYFIPDAASPDAARRMEEGPVALVKVNQGGARMMDPVVFGGGYLHMALSFLLLGIVLWVLRRPLPTFTSRVLPVILIAALAAFWTRIGEPIWFHTDWTNALYLAGADFLSLAVGGLIMALFVPRPMVRARR